MSAINNEKVATQHEKTEIQTEKPKEVVEAKQAAEQVERVETQTEEPVEEELQPVEEAVIVASKQPSAFKTNMKKVVKKTKQVAVVIGRHTKKGWKKAELAMMKGMRTAAEKTQCKLEKAIEKREKRAVPVSDENNDVAADFPVSSP